MKEFIVFTGEGHNVGFVIEQLKEELLKEKGKYIVTIDKYDEQKEISKKQMAYLHSLVYPLFAEHIGCSLLMAEVMLKRKCGKQWLVKKIDGAEVILSKKSLSIKRTNEWLKNIWEFCEMMNIHIPPPEPDWRKQQDKNGL